MSNETRSYWELFLKTLFSHKFHLFMLKNRLKANFVEAPVYRRLMSLSWVLTILAIVTFTQGWVSFLVSWVFPLVILFNISALCQILSEHRWGMLGTPELKSHARFCGEVIPQENTFWSWFLWALKMVFYHLPVRIGILSDSEICVHDHHHQFPQDNQDFPNAIYNREQKVSAGKSYHEFWGIHNAMEAVFQSLAKAPPLSDDEVKRLTK